MKQPILLIATIFFQLIFSYFVCSGQTDYTHYSKVFNREKPYRIFLPEDYFSSQKKYPVIYYFHGNTGTHEMELSETANTLVKKNSVILVAWNGRSEDSDIRPYNIGFHSNVKYDTQFKDYFLEFVSHIDSTFRTFTERENRALIGHSMGGIMSFFLAGKYPHFVGTAVNIKGSPEFFIGYPDNHSLYSVRYFFKNMYGVNLRFHNSTNGELVHLNNEVHQGALLEKKINYEYKIYEGGHSLPAEEFTDAFNFVISSFKKPAEKPSRWNHADLYPNFNVWGYEVNSNLDEPGFIELSSVTKNGFGITTKKWQPEGIPVKGVNINVLTAPVYEPDKTYNLITYSLTDNEKKITKIKSDSEGKIHISVDHKPHQFGIFKEKDSAEIVQLNYLINGESKFLDQKYVNKLKLQLINRGGQTGKGLKITLSTSTEGITIQNPVLNIDNISSAEDVWLHDDFNVVSSTAPPGDGSPFYAKFYVTVTDRNNSVWEDEFEVPVFFDVPEFTEIGIDDGDSEIFGSGNGNNIAEPGESVMIYEINHRTRLYYDDKYVDSERIYVDLQPDKWGDGYAVSSIIHISEDCPVGHKIKFLASYEIKEWKTIKRNVTWGTFTITVGEAEE